MVSFRLVTDTVTEATWPAELGKRMGRDLNVGFAIRLCERDRLQKSPPLPLLDPGLRRR
jgi:hypothetical protein